MLRKRRQQRAMTTSMMRVRFITLPEAHTDSSQSFKNSGGLMLCPSSNVELVQVSLSLSELMLSLSCRRCTCGRSSLSELSPRIARLPFGVHDRMGVFGNGEFVFVVLRCAAALPGVPCPRRVPLRRPVLDLCFDVRLPGSGLDCRLLGVMPFSLQSLSLDSVESSVIRCYE